MGLFKIAVYEEQSGYCFIVAKTKEEAEAKAEGLLSDRGIESLPNYECEHRQCDLI